MRNTLVIHKDMTKAAHASGQYAIRKAGENQDPGRSDDGVFMTMSLAINADDGTTPSSGGLSYVPKDITGFKIRLESYNGSKFSEITVGE